MARKIVQTAGSKQNNTVEAVQTEAPAEARDLAIKAEGVFNLIPGKFECVLAQAAHNAQTLDVQQFPTLTKYGVVQWTFIPWHKREKNPNGPYIFTVGVFGTDKDCEPIGEKYYEFESWSATKPVPFTEAGLIDLQQDFEEKLTGVRIVTVWDSKAKAKKTYTVKVNDVEETRYDVMKGFAQLSDKADYGSFNRECRIAIMQAANAIFQAFNQKLVSKRQELVADLVDLF
jgi:hypothetical protein